MLFVGFDIMFFVCLFCFFKSAEDKYIWVPKETSDSNINNILSTTDNCLEICCTSQIRNISTDPSS